MDLYINLLYLVWQWGGIFGVKKLGRNDRLELLVNQTRELEKLREELTRSLCWTILMPIADVALQLSGVFLEAQDDCS